MIANIRNLFEVIPKKRHHATIDHEISNIVAGLKRMSVFSFPGGTDYSEYCEIVDIAMKNGLAVSRREYISIDNTVSHNIYIFVTPITEIWRIQIYLATRKILHEYGWSDGAEFLESYILGYGEEEILNWMENIKKIRMSWSGKIFYMILSYSDVELISKLGNRCLHPKCGSNTIPVFFSRSNSILKYNAFESLQGDFVFARTSMKWCMFEKIFGNLIKLNYDDIIQSSVNSDDINDINAALQSNIQFLGRDGWS